MRYEAPESLDAAVSLLAGAPGQARILAGGTDLLVQLRAGLIEPDLVVDLKKIPAMHRITAEDGGFRIGAAVSGAELGEHPEVKRLWPGVVEAVELIGSTQIQGRATMVGNMCNASPAADSVPAMIAAGAIVAVSGPGGQREVPVEEICIAPGKTSLAKGEIVTSVFLPARPPRIGRRLSALHPAHRDGHRGGRRRRQPDARRRAAAARAARVGLGAVAARPLLVAEAAAALVGTTVDAGRARAAGRRRVGRLPADRRQARHQGIPDQGRGRAGAPGGGDRARAREGELMAKIHVTTTVNGDAVEFLCDPEQTLLDVLRDELQLTGSKEGCASGDCGACSVIAGRPAGLLLPGARRRGRGPVGRDDRGHGAGRRLHPLQQKFLEHAALQCGICTPGFLVAAKALLERDPDPSETEVRYWLAGNLCRCTGYDKIIRAVLDTAAEMRGS